MTTAVQQQADDAAAVRHVEAIQSCAFHQLQQRVKPRLGQQLLAGDGANSGRFAQQLRAAMLAGLLHFLPRQLQPGGVSQQTRLARQLMVVGGTQRQRALQH